MGRAQRGTADSGFTPAQITYLRPQRLRGFNLPRAIEDFNTASSERARLSRLTYDLATHATLRALSAAANTLTAVELALDYPNGFSQELSTALQERTHFGLHSELRVALDQGRRLRIEDIDEIALSSTLAAAAGLLAERDHALEHASALDASAWLKILRSLPPHSSKEAKAEGLRLRLREHKDSARVLAQTQADLFVNA
jgi:hypothetical protein